VDDKDFVKLIQKQRVMASDKRRDKKLAKEAEQPPSASKVKAPESLSRLVNAPAAIPANWDPLAARPTTANRGGWSLGLPSADGITSLASSGGSDYYLFSSNNNYASGNSASASASGNSAPYVM
jgi:hypothetical protein